MSFPYEIDEPSGSAEKRGERRTLRWALVAVLVVALLLVLLARAGEQLQPEPRSAWVAIETPGSPPETGEVEVAAGTAFTLHAVVEAVDWRGRPVFYTEAPRLVRNGHEVPTEALRLWDRTEETRILWFTVEGPGPYRELSSATELDDFKHRDNFRGDWPQSWSIPGSLVPSWSAGTDSQVEFGGQRFRVRVDIFGTESKITPNYRLASLGASSVPERIAELPSVLALLPGVLEVPSRAFGLTQVELGPEAPPGLQSVLVDWTGRGIAFSRLVMLRSMLDRAGTDWEALTWAPIELDGGVEFGPGDLLRAGPRVVIAFRNRGGGGLDYDDLCLDFDQGSAVRRLGDIFTGEGLIEHARLPTP